MNGSNYLGFEEDWEVAIKDEVPAVYKCDSMVCGSWNHEFLVLSLDHKNCPTCKKPGEWLRKFIGTKAANYSCGMCKRVIVISETEFPVGHYNWGFLQLTNKDPFQVICPKCSGKLRLDFPSLLKDTFSRKEEILPKIVQPSKFQHD